MFDPCTRYIQFKNFQMGKTEDLRPVKIAVVTPMYNSEKYIADAMKSVAQQIVPGYDVKITHYIVDDCSTDKSAVLVRDVQLFDFNKLNFTYNIELLHTSSNSGPAAARNLALAQIRKQEFDYVAFLDSDDKWDHRHINYALYQLTNKLSKPIDVMYSIPGFQMEDGGMGKPFGIPIDQEPTFLNILARNSIFISSVVMKAECAYPDFDSSLDGIEDWDYWLQLLRDGKRISRGLVSPDPPVTMTYLARQGGMAGVTTSEKICRMHKKYKPEGIRLNLGCGDEIFPDYINCDLYGDKSDMKFNADTIPFMDNTVDEIRAYHLFEHFTFNTAFKVLKEWMRALKPGGRLVMETPDFLNTCKKFVESDEQTRIILYGHFFAWPDLSPGQVHYFLYTETQLRWTLEKEGFVDVNRMYPDSTYAKANPQWPELYLKVEAFKPKQ